MKNYIEIPTEPLHVLLITHKSGLRETMMVNKQQFKEFQESFKRKEDYIVHNLEITHGISYDSIASFRIEGLNQVPVKPVEIVNKLDDELIQEEQERLEEKLKQAYEEVTSVPYKVECKCGLEYVFYSDKDKLVTFGRCKRCNEKMRVDLVKGQTLEIGEGRKAFLMTNKYHIPESSIGTIGDRIRS